MKNSSTTGEKLFDRNKKKLQEANEKAMECKRYHWEVKRMVEESTQNGSK